MTLLGYSKTLQRAITGCVSVTWEKDYRIRIQAILAHDSLGNQTFAKFLKSFTTTSKIKLGKKL